MLNSSLWELTPVGQYSFEVNANHNDRETDCLIFLSCAVRVSEKNRL